MNAPGGRRQERRQAHRPREQDRDVQLSKALSYVLRHGALKLGLPMQAALLQLPQFHSFTIEDVQHVVENNGKQRFALQPGEPSTGPLIRANQGHSLQVPELELTPLETPQALPLMLVHGTFWKHWPSILLKGLSRQGRAHIHLASGLPGDPGVISGQYHLDLFCPPRSPTKGHSFVCVRSPHRLAWSSTSPSHHRAPFCPGTPGPSLVVPAGMRPNCDVVVFIDGPLALADGISFFRSANGVILTPGNAEGFLLPKYFKEALQLRPTRKPLSLAGDKEAEYQSGARHSPRGGRKIQQ
ncbi:tRNA 2'-phosphotransferase 1 isoform X2 [Peromyscus californicus insignis]|uniref:tRNA 2'-phosphotransferase 1 isoform X2 n=1 Tax=Peromyscus californicus insignis TaxID=564181 RepID=UPI0022A7E96F|nr:tRNA 2'-phosphotransferase 1 isoform X2 [Peromyscus californicus insignis]